MAECAMLLKLGRDKLLSSIASFPFFGYLLLILSLFHLCSGLSLFVCVFRRSIVKSNETITARSARYSSHTIT